MHDVLDQLLTQLRGIWLRRWHAITAAWIIALVGWTMVYLTPMRYEASARVYIDTQSILKPLMSGLAVNAPIEQKVNVMTRTLLSRPNMEKVARMTDMDLKAKTNKDMEGIITGLMGDVRMSVAGQENLYMISYRNRDPEAAKKVVQSLLTILVEGSLGSKRKDTDSAKRFIDDQLKTYEQKLIVSETALKEFKQKHLGLMPGQGGDYFSKYAETSKSLNEAQLALREAENRRDSLKRQLAGDDPLLLTDNSALNSNSELDTRITDLEKRLDQMRLNYTEEHPDIIGTKRIIAQLQDQKKQEAKTKKPGTGGGAGQNVYYQQMSLSLSQAEADVASLRARVAEYSARYNQLKGAANMVPQVEAEYTALNRDYDVNRKNYDALLTRSQSAQMSEDMESKTDVIDFKVIDPPYVPPVPSFPNRPLLYSLVLVVALIGGALVGFLVSQIRPAIADRNSLAEVTDYPVLGTITMVWNNVQKRNRRKKLLTWGATVGALLSAYAMVMGLTLMATRAAT